MALELVRRQARRAIEMLYEYKCKVIEYLEVKDNKTGIVRRTEIVTVDNQPCKLSYSSITSTNQTEPIAIAAQSVKLFLAPEIIIKPNSKIIVNDVEYKASGQSAIYATHQEIMLELYKERA